MTEDDIPDDEDFDSQCWNEICEEIECDDTNYHATIEELLARIRKASDDGDALDEARDIIMQSELIHNSDLCTQDQRCECCCTACNEYCCSKD